MKNKVTLPELVSRLATATGTTKRMSELFLREMFAMVAQALANGENVSIKDIGQFKLDITSGKRTIVFKPAKHLAEVINQPFDAFVPIELDDELDDDVLNELLQTDVPGGLTDTELQHEMPVPSQPDEAPAPPPFNGDKETPAVTDGEADVPDEQGEIHHAPTPSEHDAPHTATDATISQLTHPIEDEKTPSPADDNDAAESSVTAETDYSNRQFYKGLIVGALGMLLVAVVVWLCMMPSESVAIPAVGGDSISASSPDSVSIDRRPLQTKLVTDTTSATMYLSRISKKHYGKAEFWVYIYEENKSIISDPNNIPPGTIVVIPPAEKYGIDSSSAESVEAAKRKSFELFSKTSK